MAGVYTCRFALNNLQSISKENTIIYLVEIMKVIKIKPLLILVECPG